MSAHLIIRDGATYWWLSPDIWVVPGNDPNGPAGTPVAGAANYLWARVANSGTTAANGARIDFYWADPSGQIIAGVATPVGSAFADLAPGDTQDVLCLVPWVPVIVNGGHECLLAVAHHPNDSAAPPDPLPGGFVFNPPAHDQIAQRNITVVQAARLAAPLVIAVTAPPRVARRVQLALAHGGELDERLLDQLGLKNLKPARGRSVEAGLSLEPRCGGDPEPEPDEQTLTLELAPGRAVAVYVTLRAGKLAYGEYALVHVLERQDDKVLGGVSYAVVNARADKQEKKA